MDAGWQVEGETSAGPCRAFWFGAMQRCRPGKEEGRYAARANGIGTARQKGASHILLLPVACSTVQRLNLSHHQSCVESSSCYAFPCLTTVRKGEQTGLLRPYVQTYH